MKYFCDTEFDGFGGELLSLALIREDGESLYLVYPQPKKYRDPWVAENVAPILWDIPSPLPGMAHTVPDHKTGAHMIASYLNMDPDVPYIVTDWPDDVSHLCRALMTGPGFMASVARIQFDILRVDAYPTTLKDAVRHNAWWDAQALRTLVMDNE